MNSATASVGATGQANSEEVCDGPATSNDGDRQRSDPSMVVEAVSCRNTPGFDDHEQVVVCRDPQSQLTALIAIHDTSLGPALGGCRMWPYPSERDALIDVLRLSQGMSYKHAVAGTGQGGGKAVIVGDPRSHKSQELFQAFGRFVNHFQGDYITAEDVGTSVADIAAANQTTRHVAGMPTEAGGSGDPSPFTAWGVFCGIRAAVRFQRKRADLRGVTVAVQGVGNVGYYLCKNLAVAGAELIVADVHEPAVGRAHEEFGARVVTPEDIYDVRADVFAPCALGGAINSQTVARLEVSIVAGAANNQLSGRDAARQLAKRNILYAPDYVINAGGVINISYESQGYDARKARSHTARIGATLSEIFDVAEREGEMTSDVADRMALQRLRTE